MDLYYTLERKQKSKGFYKKEEFFFYLDHRYLFSNLPIYKSFLRIEDDFDLIRANIIIRAIQNKKAIEKAILYAYESSSLKTEEVPSFISKQLLNIPYIKEGNNKIYVPIFSRSTNLLYSKNYGKLLKKPFSRLIDKFDTSCIDLFDAYNFLLYSSLFSKLVPIYQDETLLVAYHYDFKTVYFINSQGRLDIKIALFDKYIKIPKEGDILDRLKAIVKPYIDNDKDAFYNALIEQELLSKKLIHRIKHKEYRYKRRLERKGKR